MAVKRAAGNRKALLCACEAGKHKTALDVNLPEPVHSHLWL